jgi:hypothetical protein
VAAAWRHVFQFRATETQSQRFQIGPETPKGHTAEVSDVCGSLRIDFPGADYPPERYYALIICPDQGTQLFPVDLPLDLDIDLPVILQIFRDHEPGRNPRPLPMYDVTASCWKHPLTRRRYGATRVEQVLEGGTIPIPPMAQAVTLSNLAATGQWIDAAGAVLSTFIGWDNVRPRTAVQVNLLQNDSAVIFHFTT